MNDPLAQHLQTWVDNHLGHVSPSAPVAIHVDQLITSYQPGRGWFREALRAFPALVTYVHDTGDRAQLALGIALRGGGRRIRQAIPRGVDDLERQWRRAEPPSLYLLDWNLCKQKTTFERYHVPLPFALIEPALEGVCAWYEEVRGAGEATPEQYRLS